MRALKPHIPQGIIARKNIVKPAAIVIANTAPVQIDFIIHLPPVRTTLPDRWAGSSGSNR